jgi:CheY-like chemotaxis protein
MMPKVNGIVVLDWIRAQESFRNLPVIVLTNSHGNPSTENALTRGPASLQFAKVT